MLYTSSLTKSALSSSSKQKPRPKPGSHDAQQQLWTSVALQQHMLRKMSQEGRVPNELRPPRPLPEGQLSLAQKMGLVDRPADAPDDSEWVQVENQSAVRGDLSRPCAICCMPFSSSSSSSAASSNNMINNSTTTMTTFKVVGNGSSLLSMNGDQPIILSCSHTFHASCLRQLEKHAKTKRQTRRCPVCRQEGYFRRKFTAAPAILQTLAVTRIQSVFRGFYTRRRFIRLRIKIDPEFRSEYYYKKLQQMTEMRLAEHAAHEAEVDQTMDEIDYVMEISTVSRYRENEDWIDKVAKSALAREFVDCPVCLNSISEDLMFLKAKKKILLSSSSNAMMKLGCFIEEGARSTNNKQNDEMVDEEMLDKYFINKNDNDSGNGDHHHQRVQQQQQQSYDHQQQGRSIMSEREAMLMKKHNEEEQRRNELVYGVKNNSSLAAAAAGPASSGHQQQRTQKPVPKAGRRSSSIVSRINNGAATKMTSSSTASKVVVQQQRKVEPTKSETSTINSSQRLSEAEIRRLKAIVLRSIVLTSCGHLFHYSCLKSMEKFCCSSTSSDDSSSSKPKCANCRKGYLKRFLLPLEK